MSTALRLVGFEELSAGVLRTRLLDRRGAFWSGSVLPDDEVRCLHDPLFFHQLGGFGAVALTADDQDAGYLLGVAEGLTKVFYPEASNIVIFVIMAIVLILRPAGLFGKEA